MKILSVGVHMEDTIEMVKAAKAEMDEVVRSMEAAKLQVFEASDIVGPLLVEEVKRLRSARMAVMSEVRDSLKALEDVRAFFGPEHAQDVQRMERMISACKEIKALKDEGVLDVLLALRK